jgi:hypothetical protein
MGCHHRTRGQDRPDLLGDLPAEEAQRHMQILVPEQPELPELPELPESDRTAALTNHRAAPRDKRVPDLRGKLERYE